MYHRRVVETDFREVRRVERRRRREDVGRRLAVRRERLEAWRVAESMMDGGVVSFVYCVVQFSPGE